MSRDDKIRFERLQLVCRKALEQSIRKSLSLDDIVSCYPTVASTKEGLKSLEIARLRIVEFWFENSLKEFKLIFEERAMEEKLNELDELISKGFKRWERYQEAQAQGHGGARDALEGVEGPIFLDQLTPDQIMDANIAHTKQNTINKLNMILDQLRLDNEDLHDQLKVAAEESQELKRDILSEVEFFNEGIASLKTENDTVLKNLDNLIDSLE